MLAENILFNGAISGFIAVVVMTIFMMIAKKTGMAPKGLDIGLMLGSMIIKNNPDKARKVGMMMHIINGAIFGIIFVFIGNYLIFSNVLLQALTWSVILWLIMMVIIMPMMGKGIFGKNISPKVPLLTLILHLIFGLVLGLIV